MRWERMGVWGVVVAAVLAGSSCSERTPLSIGAVRDCITPDSGIAVPVDTALYAVSVRRCLDGARA